MKGKFVSLNEYMQIRETELKAKDAYEYSEQWYRDKAVECAKIAKLNRAFYRRHGEL